MNKEFKLISSPREDRIEKQVNDMLNDGWEILGSPFVSPQGTIVVGLVNNNNKTTKTSSRASAK